MKVGFVYPQNEVPATTGALRDIVLTLEGIGYDHMLVYEHILGANPNRPGGWTGIYSSVDSFWDPFTMFSYLAGTGSKLEFVTGVLVLPQRQAVVAAKQAACVDLMTDGKLRLGVGLGWNEVEYAGLGENFNNRGARIEEQVKVMRQLWTKPLVTYAGRWHAIDDCGINPLPVQRPIPVWFGGGADKAIERMARMGDGWFPGPKTVADARPQLELMDASLKKNGRSWQSFGLEPRVMFKRGKEDEFKRHVSEWMEAGATHICVNTLGLGFDSSSAHVDALGEAIRLLKA